MESGVVVVILLLDRDHQKNLGGKNSLWGVLGPHQYSLLGSVQVLRSNFTLGSAPAWDQISLWGVFDPRYQLVFFGHAQVAFVLLFVSFSPAAH